MLERERELSALDAAIEDAAAGRGAAVLLEAPAGAGKTTLLDWSARRAQGAGLRTLRASGSPLDANVSFEVVRHLLGRVQEPPADAAAIVLGLRTPEPGERAEPADALHALYWLTVDLSRDAGLVLLVDDLHLVDRQSLRFLEHLVRRLDGLPIALLLAGRPVDPPTAQAELTSLRSRTPVVLTPRPLTTEAVGLLVREVFGNGDAVFAEACHRASDGNPLLLAELLSALRDRGVVPAPEAVDTVLATAPDGVHRRIDATLLELGADARRLAMAIDTLEGPALEATATLAEIALPQAGALVEAMRGAGLLAADDPLRFAHPLFAQAVRMTATPAERSHWHERAAALMQARGAPVEAVASHLLFTLPAGREATVATLRSAAAAVQVRGGADAACTFLERAFGEPVIPALEPQLALEAGEAMGRAQRWPDALRVLARGLRSEHAGELRYSLTMAIARAAHSCGRYDEAIAALREATALAATDADRSAAQADLLALSLMDPVHRRAAAGQLEQARAEWLAGTLEDRAMLAIVATAEVLAARPVQRAAATLRAYLGTADVQRAVDEDLSTGWAVLALDAADGTLDALAFVERGLADARQRSHQRAIVYYRVLEGWNLYRLGRIREAHVAATEARRLAGGAQEGFDNATFTLQGESLCLAHVLIERSEPEVALRLAESTQVADPTPEYLATVHHVRGRALLAMGRPPAALAALEAAGTILTELDCQNPVFNAWRVSAVRAALEAGRTDTATEHATVLGTLADRSGLRSLRGYALRAAAFLAPDSEAVELLDEAISALAETPYEQDRAVLRLDQGRRLLAGGHREDARGPLREALAIADRLGAQATGDAAREALIAAGARPRRAALTGAASLAPSELRVAELAASGLKNREIAEQLFVTIKTVETALTSTYAKLAVTGRHQLATALREATPG